MFYLRGATEYQEIDPLENYKDVNDLEPLTVETFTIRGFEIDGEIIKIEE
jgi:hypothetical protein